MAKRKNQVLAVAVVVLMFGLAGWAVLLQMATDVVNLPPAEVMAEFADLRAGLPDGPPMLLAGPDGRVGTNPETVDDPSAKPRWLKVRVYDAAAGRLVRVELPFWWVRLKKPVFELVLRKAGADPDRLGVTVDDLRRHGTGVVIDDARPDGDILLVWTE